MTTLARTLRLRDLVFLIVGTVIGSGIFLVPGSVLRQVDGRPGPALTVWVIGGVLSLLGALTYGELSATNPRAGGLYVYIRDCFGRFPAFLYGWTLFFAISSGSAATLSVAFSAYLGEVVPLSPVGARLVSVGMIAAVALINIRGARQSATLQNWTTAAKVGAILLMSVSLIFLGSRLPSMDWQWPSHIEVSLLSGAGLAMIGVLWAYEGWQYGTFAAGETMNAGRNFPRAYLAGLSVLMGVYLMANLGYVSALGPEGVSRAAGPASAAVSEVFGSGVAVLVTLAILISIFSAANGLTLTAPRVYYAMARDRLFFARLAEVHSKFRTPALAVGAGSIWGAVLALTGTFEQLLTYVVFTGWLFYGLGAAAIFVYRKRIDASRLPYRVPGYPLTPAIFILAALAIVLNTFIAQPVEALAGIGIVMSGAPAYYFWKSRSSRNSEDGSESGDTGS